MNFLQIIPLKLAKIPGINGASMPKLVEAENEAILVEVENGT